jgi:hypothetical protein
MENYKFWPILLPLLGDTNLFYSNQAPTKTEILNILGTNLAQMTGTCGNNYIMEGL